MKKQVLIFSIFAIVLSCKGKEENPATDVEVWKLGWRLIANAMEENDELANAQFDSLWHITNKIDYRYLVTGLEVKHRIGNLEEMSEILKAQQKEMLQEICLKPFLANLKPCLGFSEEKVEDKDLQMELISMFIDDQAIRGNVMKELILKYGMNEPQLNQNGFAEIDERNRKRIEEIVKNHGFPTRKLVGKEAMQGIFMIIQHADRDKEWQQTQLENIEIAVKKGDLDGQSYAYLYDRIRVNNGEKQLYGTQFSKVDPVNKTVELAPTEDIEHLDERRMEIGVMPIDIYKILMVNSL